MTRSVCALLLGILFAGCDSAPASPVADATLDPRFATELQPFFSQYCFGCHGAKKHKGDLDLSRDFSVEAIVKNPRLWEQVRSRLHAREMPPEDASKQPAAAERDAALAWLRDLDDREARRNAGDPGLVLARRLSNAEYDNTIRDLTGVDLRPTREFPVDPANEAGFDNTGESLTMSEALLRKYLAAARHVADHLVLKPEGFVFAPHPAVTDTDRDKYCVQRIVAFYNRHPVDLAAYFAAASCFRHQSRKCLKDLAAESGLSATYLESIWSLLEGDAPASGPIAELRALWPDASPEDLAAAAVRLRAQYPAKAEAPQPKGMSRGSQPLLLWRNDRLASQHRAGGVDDPAVARFCSVIPDAFVVLERGPYYDKSSSPRGRFLSAGFHLMLGYYRDDGPLYDLILDDAARREIDTLWADLHFVCQDALRQYKDFIFFERAEAHFLYEPVFDFARSEDKDASSDANIQRLREVYLEKVHRVGASETIVGAVETYFKTITARIRQTEEARAAAEPGHLKALLEFAARAYRRPLSGAEREALLKFYRQLREQDQLGHEEALRDAVAGVLMSPHFCYRFTETSAGPLSNAELASRLSYFLWSSMPDAELLAADLRKPGILQAQALRLLRDARVRCLATGFVGNWLDFRRFEEHNAVDRERFPSFTNELRQAMFEEPVRYFLDIVRRDRPLLDLLYGKDIVVNGVLAKHYGIGSVTGDDWVAIDDARSYGRGGLLPMAVFLTKNAPGLRTSPVKRGYWVVRRLLGEVIPPPPPTVPSLPKDEAALGDLTLPQVLARHRDDRACAGCHNRFDAVGVVFEGFGPIGERRDLDLGGKPVQTRATFPDGRDRDGLAGLRDYIAAQRQADFVDNLCKKRVSCALGRGLVPTDRGTWEAMRAQGERFGDDDVDKAPKPQFLTKRASP